MEINAEELSDTRMKITVTVPGDRIAEEEKRVLGEFAKQASLPGFRPGKAPASMIRSKYKNEVKQEVEKKLAQEAFQKGVESQNLSLYQLLEVNEFSMEPGEDCPIELTLDHVPDFPLPEYKEVTVQVPSAEVSDEEFKSTKDYLLNQRAEYNVVERPAEAGDYVKVSYEGKIDGQPITEIAEDAPLYGTQTNTWEEAGQSNAPGVQAVVDGVIGLAPGDEKDVEQSFPDDFHVEALQGKTATYHISVHEVRQKVLPEVNEDFLKGFGVETEDEFDERIREDVGAQKQQQINEQKRNQLLEKLLSGTPVPVPESQQSNLQEQNFERSIDRYRQQGATEEQLEEHKEQLWEGAGQQAVNQAKAEILLSRIAEAEKIQIEEQDLQQAIITQAQQTRQNPAEIVDVLKKNPDRLQALRHNVLMGKTLDYLVGEAQVIEVESAAAPAS